MLICFITVMIYHLPTETIFHYCLKTLFFTSIYIYNSNYLQKVPPEKRKIEDGVPTLT